MKLLVFIKYIQGGCIIVKKSLKKAILASLASVALLANMGPLAVYGQDSNGLLSDVEETELEESSDDVGESEASEEEASESTEEESEDTEEESPASAIDWSEVEAAIQENMEAESIELLFESSEAIEFNENDVTSVLEGYAYYQVENFDRDFRIQYDQDELGGVLVLKVNLENNTDGQVYHNNLPRIQAAGTDEIVGESSNMMGYENEDYFDPTYQVMEAGDSKTGYLSYYILPEVMESIEANGSLNVEFFGFRNQEDYSGSEDIMANPIFMLPFSEEAAEQATATSGQYPDRIISDNMGNKTLIDEAEGINASQEEEEIVVTVDGFQISEFVPNSDYEEAVGEFPGGVVLVNVKVDITNNSEDTIDLGGVYSSLVLGGMVEVRNNNFLQEDAYGSVIEPGETGTTYQLFSIEGDLFDKFESDTFTFVPSIKTTDYDDLHDYQAIQIDFR